MVLGHDLCTGQRTEDVRVSEDVSFETMLLRKATLKGLNNAGFLRPSPIQLHAIPLGKCGFDLLLEAKSGTGKTAVFTVISLEKLDLTKGVQTIILAPTREIAYQISDVISDIGSYFIGLNVAVVMGGLPVKDDIDKFSENVHIVVGSPGRLRHLIQDKHINLSAVRLFVLDEADKLLSDSFLSDINYIFSVLPKQKQVIMSSATYSEEIKTFIKRYVKKSQHICPDSTSVLLGISQKVTIIPSNSNVVKQTEYRYEELKKILNSKQFKQCLIFCNYQVRVGELHRMLSRDKWPAEQLYGQQDQTDRLDALKTLQEYKCRILVSTDLAARGIDASNVDIVINFEPPYEWETYLHRIGRAGRYGSYGTAISILSEGTEKKKFKNMLALTSIPFNLQDLWTNEPFNLNFTDISLESAEKSIMIAPDNKILDNGEKSEDILWKALITKDIKSEISSFKELCDSFQIPNEPSIETFSDLMQSFKVNQNNINNDSIENIEFKHVKVAKLPITEIKQLDKSHIRYTKQLKNPTINTKNNTPPINNTNSMRNRDFLNQKEFSENERHLTEGMEKEILMTKNLTNGYAKSDDKIYEDQATSQKDFRRKSDEICSNPSNQTSIDMGLPTDFGKCSLESYKGQTLRNISKYHNHTNNKNNLNNTDLIKQAVADVNFPTHIRETNGESHEGIKSDRKIKREKTEIDQDKPILDANDLGSPKQNKHDRIHENSNDYYDYERNSYNNSIKDSIKQALIEAGLPTAFGKKEKNKYRSNTSYKGSIKTNQPDVKLFQQEPFKLQEIHRKDLKGISSNRTFTRDSWKKSSFTTVVESGQSDSDSEIGINGKPTFKSKNEYASNTSNYKKSCHQSKNCSSIEQIREKQFDNWYNYLKHQTQAIQYALYIEELRKL